MTKESNGYNAHRRFERSCVDDTNYDTEEVSVGKKAVVLLKGARTQFLRLVSKLGKSRVDLVSKEGDDHSVLQLNVGEGTSMLQCKYGSNLVSVNLDAKNSNITLSVETDGVPQSQISLADLIKIVSKSSVSIEEESIPQVSEQWVDRKDELDMEEVTVDEL